MMSEDSPKTWYILKQPNGQCQIAQIAPGEESPDRPDENQAPDEQWGPFSTENEAIARRVGLIRAGKCLPA